MITIITTAIVTAIIGGVFGVLFGRINRKLDTIEEQNKKRHEESVKSRECDHELLLATATVTEMLARKFNDENVNGELKEAEDELEKTRKEVERMTRHIFYKHLEGD